VTSDTRNQDFATYREAVADQNSRIDAIDASLAAVAALLFAIITFLPEHRRGAGILEWHFELAANILIISGILASLLTAVAFRGSEGPRLDILLDEVRTNREKTLDEVVTNLAQDYYRNSLVIKGKIEVLRLAIGAGATGALVVTLSPVIH